MAIQATPGHRSLLRGKHAPTAAQRIFMREELTKLNRKSIILDFSALLLNNWVKFESFLLREWNEARHTYSELQYVLVNYEMLV